MSKQAIGVVRRVDELGRVVLPKETRRMLDINERDPIEFYVTEDTIVLKKYSADKACMITGEVTSNPISLCDGKIVLSREGGLELMKTLQKEFGVKS